MINSLELFSGTKSFSKYNNYNNISVDIDNSNKPTFNIDIMEFDYKKYDIGYFSVIWASPPCTEYSTCLTTRSRNLELADMIVKKTLEIINYLKPKYYYIENPFTGLLKTRPFMIGKYYFKVDYCKYGKNYRKRTAIWTNNYLFTPRILCNKKNRCESMIGNKHIGHFGTSSSSCSLEEKHSIPRDLIMQICSYN